MTLLLSCQHLNAVYFAQATIRIFENKTRRVKKKKIHTAAAVVATTTTIAATQPDSFVYQSKSSKKENVAIVSVHRFGYKQMLRFIWCFSLFSQFYFYIIWCVFLLCLLLLACAIDTRAKKNFSFWVFECERDILCKLSEWTQCHFCVGESVSESRDTQPSNERTEEEKNRTPKGYLLLISIATKTQFDPASWKSNGISKKKRIDGQRFEGKKRCRTSK